MRQRYGSYEGWRGTSAGPNRSTGSSRAATLPAARNSGVSHMVDGSGKAAAGKRGRRLRRHSASPCAESPCPSCEGVRMAGCRCYSPPPAGAGAATPSSKRAGLDTGCEITSSTAPLGAVTHTGLPAVQTGPALRCMGRVLPRRRFDDGPCPDRTASRGVVDSGLGCRLDRAGDHCAEGCM